MIIKDHAKYRAKQLLPEVKYLSKDDIEDFIRRMLRGGDILTPEEAEKRFAGFKSKQNTTYYVLDSIILAVQSGVVWTIIDYKRIPKTRRLAHVRGN